MRGAATGEKTTTPVLTLAYTQGQEDLLRAARLNRAPLANREGDGGEGPPAAFATSLPARRSVLGCVSHPLAQFVAT